MHTHLRAFRLQRALSDIGGRILGVGPVPGAGGWLRDRILAAHHLLRALAIEAAAFAAEFGSDPRGPDLQAAADRWRTDLTACIETIDLDR